MSFFEGAANFAIFGGTYIAATAGSTITVDPGGRPRGSVALTDLSAAAAHTALHDSAARFNAPRCYRNTRTKYLNKFERWMLGVEEEWGGKRLIWLHGAAGAGKSAIVQSLIERRACYEVILGAFFFSRADQTRDYAEVLIPTLAYQVARAFPAAMTVLEPIILGDPLIFKASAYTQAYQLLVQPILYLIENGFIDTYSAPRRVFLIDGLDECNDPEKQALIINIVAGIISNYHLPINFLIASRPELAITSAFHREKQLHSVFASISLESDKDTESDIRNFIEDSFLDILDGHPWRTHIRLPWPSAASINRLVRLSSGHFIFAATAMKFIASSDEHPERALMVVEGIVPTRTGSPFAELDSLYMHILTHAKYSKQVINILAHCYFTEFTRSVRAISYIHDILSEDVILFLSDVRSIISLIPKGIAELTITLNHASLYDFLTTKERAQALYIERRSWHASLLPRYFRLLDNGPHPPTSSFFFVGTDAKQLIAGLTSAICDSQDTNLCVSLIKQHSSVDIWNFWVELWAPISVPSSMIRDDAANSIYDYMCAIRKFSIAICDRSLFFTQFTLYVEMILDELKNFVPRRPQHCIIPAIMFSSSPSGLYWAFYLLWKWGRRFRIDPSYEALFRDADLDVTYGEIELSFEAIRCSPLSRVSWGSPLAHLMKLVLDQLVVLSKPSSMPYHTPHRRWLRRNKPQKHTALGSPRLSSAVASILLKVTHPDGRFAKSPYHTTWRPSLVHIWNCWNGRKIYPRKLKCLTLLKTVIFYLRKSNSSFEVVQLARRSLPIAAQWYPKLMKRARAEMDAYVRRWNESPNGFVGGGIPLGLKPRVLDEYGNPRHMSWVRAYNQRARYSDGLRKHAVTAFFELEEKKREQNNVGEDQLPYSMEMHR